MNINFEVKNRFTGKVQFTAEIECQEGDSHSVKLGLAIKWALKNKVSLAGADMAGANMEGANMAGADMAGANMEGANMAGAYMAGAYMPRANMEGAYMAGAYMPRANMEGANMAGAYMPRANMEGANMAGADMEGADMEGANGLNDWIKCIQIEDWSITYTSEIMQIGCQRHKIYEWLEFDDATIAKMDRRKALKFWRKWKPWIFQAIEMCPAKPMKVESPVHESTQ